MRGQLSQNLLARCHRLCMASLADYMDVLTFGEIEAQSKDSAGDAEAAEDKL